MATRADVHRLVDQLDGSALSEALSFLARLRFGTPSGSAEKSDIDAPPDDDLDEDVADDVGTPTSADDPLWRIVGIGRSDEPTDVGALKDEYLAEAHAAWTRRA